MKKYLAVNLLLALQLVNHSNAEIISRITDNSFEFDAACLKAECESVPALLCIQLRDFVDHEAPEEYLIVKDKCYMRRLRCYQGIEITEVAMTDCQSRDDVGVIDPAHAEMDLRELMFRLGISQDKSFLSAQRAVSEQIHQLMGKVLSPPKMSPSIIQSENTEKLIRNDRIGGQRSFAGKLTELLHSADKEEQTRTQPPKNQPIPTKLTSLDSEMKELSDIKIKQTVTELKVTIKELKETEDALSECWVTSTALESPIVVNDVISANNDEDEDGLGRGDHELVIEEYGDNIDVIIQETELAHDSRGDQRGSIINATTNKPHEKAKVGRLGHNLEDALRNRDKTHPVTKTELQEKWLKLKKQLTIIKQKFIEAKKELIKCKLGKQKNPPTKRRNTLRSHRKTYRPLMQSTSDDEGEQSKPIPPKFPWRKLKHAFAVTNNNKARVGAIGGRSFKEGKLRIMLFQNSRNRVLPKEEKRSVNKISDYSL